MYTRSRKTFCPATTQQINYSVIQASNSKVTHKSNRPVTKSVNKPSLKSSIHLITNSPHHQFVQTALRTIT